MRLTTISTARASASGGSRRGAPPFLILHGDGDTIVPVSQSVFLYEALWRAGADVRLHIVHSGDHLDWRRSSADIPWQASEIKNLEDAFFYRTLKGHERTQET
jgi:acetyl esterase/lipase